MVDVRSKKCHRCKVKRPLYNKAGETSALYCGDCKEPDMVDVKNKKCHKCKVKIPVFNITGETSTLYCGDCKEPDMVDVKNKKCSYENCNISAYYGLPGHKKETCYQHRKEGYIANPNKKCIEKNCKQMAIYGYTSAKHCEEHKHEDEVDLIQRKCKACGLIEVVNKDGYCYCQNQNLFNRIRLAKQKTVKNYLDRNCEIKYISYDKQIDHGVCGRERPDFLYDCESFYIVLEVDEDQHEQRNCDCEQVRMINISQSLGMKTLFIRYNPDKYKVKNGGRMQTENKRLQTLLDVLLYYKKNGFKDYCMVTHMYFDEDEREEWFKPHKLL
jgi:hypothetical protein